MNDSLLSIVECLCLCESSHYLLGRGLLFLVPRFFGQSLLLVVVIEDGGHVLPRGTTRGVMVLPEQFEHFQITCDLGVVLNLHALCVVPTEGEMFAKTVNKSTPLG